jgi:hypothetical protein
MAQDRGSQSLRRKNAGHHHKCKPDNVVPPSPSSVVRIMPNFCEIRKSALAHDANLQHSEVINGEDTMLLPISTNPPLKVEIQECLSLMIEAGRIGV